MVARDDGGRWRLGFIKVSPDAKGTAKGTSRHFENSSEVNVKSLLV